MSRNSYNVGNLVVLVLLVVLPFWVQCFNRDSLGEMPLFPARRRLSSTTTMTTTATPSFWVSSLCAPQQQQHKQQHKQQQHQRREFLRLVAVTGNLAFSTTRGAAKAATTTTTRRPGGLAAQLASRDPTVLKNSLFNIPPSVLVYPEWMRGEWLVTSRFSGYLFPSTNIPKSTLLQNVLIPGFQKCSIAATADVGKDPVPAYGLRIDPLTGWEDRQHNWKTVINAYLGYPAVQSVVYDGAKNPNRVGIDFVDYRTINAERIELFCNARDSESYTTITTNTNNHDEDPTTATNNTTTTTTNVFVASEHVKQVTFGTGSTVGVPRQVTTNYGLYWTWQQQQQQQQQSPIQEQRPKRTLQGNLLVAAYLDPQDALYFQEPVQPVVVYSHVLSAIQQQP